MKESYYVVDQRTQNTYVDFLRMHSLKKLLTLLGLLSLQKDGRKLEVRVGNAAHMPSPHGGEFFFSQPAVGRWRDCG